MKINSHSSILKNLDIRLSAPCASLLSKTNLTNCPFLQSRAPLAGSQLPWLSCQPRFPSHSFNAHRENTSLLWAVPWGCSKRSKTGNGRSTHSISAAFIRVSRHEVLNTPCLVTWCENRVHISNQIGLSYRLNE